MKRLSRSAALKIAAVLSLAMGLVTVVWVVPLLALGANELDQTRISPPYSVVMVAFIFAIVRIVAAYGVWLGHRWAIVLTLLAVALDTVAAVPGLLFAPTQALGFLALIGVITGVVTIVLCLWRGPKVIAAQIR